MFIVSGFTVATSLENNPPNVPSNPHPEDGAIDIGVKTHLSWCGGDPDPGDKAVYDLYFGNVTNPSLIVSDLDKPNYYPGVLEHTTQYFWKVFAKDQNGGVTSGPEWTFTTNNCTCDPPDKPSGPTRVRNRERYNYSTQMMNHSQNGYYYNFSWGDGNQTGWIGPYTYNERVRAEYEWEEPGKYQVQVRARFRNGRTLDEWTTTGWSEPLFVTVSSENPPNEAPTAPEINGPTKGKIGVEYNYTFISTDPDGDDLYYVVNWGCCGCENHTYGPYESGEMVTVGHSWVKKGTFIIIVKVKDVYGLESPESTLSVTMPRDKSINNFYLRLLNRYPHAFLLLRYLMGL